MTRTECPSPETLAAYTLGDLPEPELSAVAEHLDHCTECEEHASRLDGIADPVVSQLRRFPNPYFDSDEPDTEHAGSGETPRLPKEVESWGEFRIVREIGRGGMGVVCEAYQGSLNRHVALKFLPELGDLARFRREARAAGRLHHTNIVPVFGVGAQDGRHFYVMQYISGHGLDAVLKKNNGSASPSDRFDDREATRIGVQVAEALAYAHAQGVIHRDIKPSNLLLDDHGTVWVTDFGLAHDASDTITLTQTGDFLGTLRYVAPERLSGRGDERADIYGLGVTLYELLCGRPAYAEADRSVLVHQILHHDPPRPRQIHTAIARDLETIVVKAMEREPGQRYATAEALADDLRRFLDDRTILARRVGAWERAWRWSRRRPVQAVLGACLVLSILLGIRGLIWQSARATHKGEIARRVNDFFFETILDALDPVDSAVNRGVTVGTIFDHASSRVETQGRVFPEVDASERWIIGTVLLQLGEYEKAEHQLRTAHSIFTRMHDLKHFGALGTGEGLARRALIELGRFDEGGKLAERVYATYLKHDGPHSPGTLGAQLTLAKWQHATGRLAEAEANVRQVRNEIERQGVRDERLTRRCHAQLESITAGRRQ